MGLFDNVLKSEESLFLNEESLSPEWVPKLLPFREIQQKRFAHVIKPLFNGRSGPSLFVTGAPGIGKTAAVKVVLRELEESTEGVEPLYVNCWQKNTTFKVYVELCHLLGYRFTQNKKSEDLLEVIKGIVNKKAGVFVFDEIDKAEDLGFLYAVLEELYTRTIIILSNEPSWIATVDARIRSRLLPELITFNPYTRTELHDILERRAEIAFPVGVWEPAAFDLAVDKASLYQDVRIGLHVLKEAGRTAEDSGSKKITKEHAEQAISRMAQFEINSDDELGLDDHTILALAREHSGKRIGELFELYQEREGKISYKTFQRRIEHLAKNKYLTTEKKLGGDGGTTTIVSVEKQLTEFEEL